MRKLKLILAALSLSLLLTGCRQDLYSGMQEADANEMLLTLLQHGVPAQKSAEGKGLYKVEVESADLTRALEIIRDQRLPRPPYQTLGQVFTGDAVIASQLEEQARLSFALSQELAATFSKIDGVLDARVHVVLVQHDQSSGVTTPPSAAVFIKHLNSSPVTSMIADIKDTAARAVPGLTHERVSVMLESFRDEAIAPAVPAEAWYSSKVMMFVYGLIAATAVLGGLLTLMLRSKWPLLKKLRTKTE